MYRFTQLITHEDEYDDDHNSSCHHEGKTITIESSHLNLFI